MREQEQSSAGRVSHIRLTERSQISGLVSRNTRMSACPCTHDSGNIDDFPVGITDRKRDLERKGATGAAEGDDFTALGNCLVPSALVRACVLMRGH